MPEGLLATYDVLEVLAANDRGIVERARRRSDGLPVVLKRGAGDFPSPEVSAQLELESGFLTKLSREAEARGQRPWVIAPIALERRAERNVLVIEDFGACSLRMLLAVEVRLPDFLRLAADLARAIGFVHACDVAHLDLNPQNVVVNPTTGVLKLIDFGNAQALPEGPATALPVNGLSGTLPYLAPEQSGRMNRGVDYRADHYALGATYYEMLTGRPPFQATDAIEYIHCHVSKQAPDVRLLRPEVPEPLARLVAKLLAKDPEDRYQSAAAIVRDLLAIQASSNDASRASREPAPIPTPATATTPPPSGEAGAACSSGCAPRFMLGQGDVSPRFRVVSTLVGRSAEAAALANAFARSCEEASALAVVAGAAGVGKSALARSLSAAVAARHGTLVVTSARGGSDLPFRVLARSLGGLLRQMLASSEEELGALRRGLDAQLQGEAGALALVVPEVLQVLGSQQPEGEVPPAWELGGREAKVRLQRVVGRLLRALARPERPLVLVLDDMHEADTATIELLASLIGDPDLRGLFVVLAYASDSPDEARPLEAMVSEVATRKSASVLELRLAPLGEEDVVTLLAATLSCTGERVHSLARRVLEKTAGNAFFLNEFLRSLHTAGVFRYASEDGIWVWDDEAVARSHVQQNVARFMADRLHRLSPKTLETLEAASCFSRAFGLEELAAALGAPPSEATEGLRAAFKEGVLRSISTNAELAGAGDGFVDFQHPRVREAAYERLDGPTRARLHHRIGAHLLQQASEHDENLFEIVNHLNLGRELLAAPGRRTLADLARRAGERARRGTAYAIASRYYMLSVELRLPDPPPPAPASPPDGSFEDKLAAGECAALAGDSARAGAIADELIAEAADAVARGAAYRLKASLHSDAGRLKEALATALIGLAGLGVVLPTDPAAIEPRIGAGIGQMLAHLARTPIEDLAKLPEMVDREKIEAIRLLVAVIPAAFQVAPPVFVLAELTMFDLALTHGVSKASAKNLVDCAIILGSILGDHARACRLGDAAIQLVERYRPHPYEGAVHFIIGAFIDGWRSPIEQAIEALDRGEVAALRAGDLIHVRYTQAFRLNFHFMLGRGLEDCKRELEAATAALGGFHPGDQATHQLDVYRIALARLVAEDAEDPAPYVERLTSESSGSVRFVFHYVSALVEYILGDHEAARVHQKAAATDLPAATGLIGITDHVLVGALLLADSFAAAPAEERPAIRAQVAACAEKLAVWAESCPANFAHKHALVTAELARLNGGSIEDVLRLYDHAVEAAKSDFVHLRALASERAGAFLLARGLSKIARPFIEEARFLYGRWGATRKTAALELQYPKWLKPAARPSATLTTSRSLGHTRTASTAHHSSDEAALDVLSIMKTAQALSSEIKPAALYAKLMGAIVENVGAERGCLLLPCGPGDELRLVLQTRASGAHDLVDQPVAVAGDLSLAVVRYVARTKEILALDDARNDPRYRLDPHVKQHDVRSVLCAPLMNQGRLVAIIYVENNAVSHAFTTERLAALQMIGAQAAISITNARLYDTLESKVAERTQALAARTQEMTAMFDSIEQGIFVIDETMQVLPRYSAHLERVLGTSAIAGRNCIELLFDGADVGSDARDIACGNLAASLGVARFFAELNLAQAPTGLLRKNPTTATATHLEIQWTPIGEDDDAEVRHILVTVRDVSRVRELEATLARNGRDLDLVGQIVEAGLDAFRRFAPSTRRLLEGSAESVRTGPQSEESYIALARDLHTLKGNARLLGLGPIANRVHDAEQCLVNARAKADKDKPDVVFDRESVLAGIRATLDVLAEYEDVLERKLGQDGGRTSGAEEVLAEISAAVEQGRVGDGSRVLAQIEEIVGRALAVPLRDIVRDTSRMLPSLARELGKAEPIVEVDDDPLHVRGPWARVIRDALVHVFRNAVDHGIEANEERAARHKPGRGTICVRVVRAAERAEVHVSDDGRGLRLDALRKSDPGLSDELAADRVFQSGVTTASAVSSISGRGVGMEAVRAFLRNKGGDARIVFTSPLQDGCRPFALVFELPAGALAA